MADEDKKDVHEVPSGKWKRGLCDCFNACACPCLMGWCCFPILLGQLIERLKFGICGCPTEGKSPPVCMIFTIFFVIALIVEIVINAVMYATFDYSSAELDYLGRVKYEDAPLYFQILVWIPVAFGWLIFIAGCCTRMNMRKKYKMDTLCFSCCDGCCDDCLLTYCCHCCSTIQMVRQTHDEDEYPYSMTSSTGLPSGAPELV